VATSVQFIFSFYVQVYIENDFKELNVCIQYPPTQKNGVPVKKLASRESYKSSEAPSSVGQHCAYGLLHVSSPSRMSTLSTPMLQKKKLTNIQLYHRVHGGTGRKNLPSKSSKKLFDAS
jgi:hypothetical protein